MWPHINRDNFSHCPQSLKQLKAFKKNLVQCFLLKLSFVFVLFHCRGFVIYFFIMSHLQGNVLFSGFVVKVTMSVCECEFYQDTSDSCICIVYVFVLLITDVVFLNETEVQTYVNISVYSQICNYLCICTHACMYLNDISK